jgi:sugar/nucleoside kinase (ribokinase family)
VRENTDELLNQIDIAVVSERFCQQLGMSTGETLSYLRTKNCPVGAVTLGSEGMVWYEAGGPDKVMPALNVPLSKVVDSNGAGDVFHGAYIASYLRWPERSWDQHFRFARGASTHAIQHLGNEASLPTLEDIERANATYSEKAVA